MEGIGLNQPEGWRLTKFTIPSRARETTDKNGVRIAGIVLLGHVRTKAEQILHFQHYPEARAGRAFSACAISVTCRRSPPQQAPNMLSHGIRAASSA